ncbi:unnamed protein product [Phytomonas sp. Hart1]|nr:unnamed protein product [Phytomonas sp. Hart1]|eukprot:CCW66182.1 unnamed protein product [Phytomonas sp. isolate Hart1]
MNKPAQETEYKQVGSAVTTDNRSYPSPSFSIDEIMNKSSFHISDASCLCVTSSHTHSSIEPRLPLTNHLTDDEDILPQSECKCNNGSVFSNQDSANISKDHGLNSVCRILNLEATTPTDENVSDAGVNTLNVETEVRFPEDKEEFKQVNSVVRDSTDMIPNTNKRTLEQSKKIKPHSMKAKERSSGPENFSTVQIHEVTTPLNTCVSFPETAPGTLNTLTTLPPCRRSMNECSFNSQSSGSLIKNSSSQLRSVRPAHQHLGNPQKIAPSPPVSFSRVSEKLKLVSTNNSITSGKSDVKSSTSLQRQSSSLMADKKNEPNSFLEVIKRKTNVSFISPPRIVGSVKKGPVAGPNRGQPDPSPVRPAVRLIPEKFWRFISSKLYKCYHRKLFQHYKIFKMQKATVRRRHRSANPPHHARGRRVRDAPAKGREPESPKVQLEKPKVSFSILKKGDPRLKKDGNKSFSLSSTPPQSPLPLSPTSVAAKREVPTVVVPFSGRLVLQKQPQLRVKGLDLSLVNKPSLGRGKVEATGRFAPNAFSEGPRTPLTSDNASISLNVTNTFSHRSKGNIYSPIVSARTSLPSRTSRSGISSTSRLQPRSLSRERSRSLDTPERERPEVAKFVIIPLLSSPEERERTATVVFDLDETLCNNRVSGPPLLRPGAVRLLQDLRAMYGRPRYKSCPFSSSSPHTKATNPRSAIQFSRFASTLAICNGSSTSLASNESEVRLELVLWTASIGSVAKRVVDRLDPFGDVFDQIIYQDPRWYSNDESYTKDLRLLGRNMMNVVIIENSIPSVKCNRRNAILVTDFSFNRNDRQLLVVRSILMEWLGLLNAYWTRLRNPNHLPASECKGDGRNQSVEKELGSCKMIDDPMKNPVSSQIQGRPMDDVIAFSCLNQTAQYPKSSRTHLGGATVPFSFDSLIHEKGKISIVQFLSLHDYIQKGTNYVRLSVVSHVAQLYGDPVKGKQLEGPMSARTAYVNSMKKDDTNTNRFSQSNCSQPPKWFI